MIIKFCFYYLDIFVTTEYFLRGCLVWFYLEIGILFIPTSLIQILSLKWYNEDGNLKKIHWISHFFLIGILYRLVLFLQIYVFHVYK